MKVLHVYRTFFPDTQGGLEETIRQLCVNSRKYGVTSKVFTLSTNPEPKIVKVDGIEVHRAKQVAEIASFSISFDAFKMHDQLVDWADVINYHFPWPFADVLSLHSKINKPRIVTYHSDIIRQRIQLTFYRPLMQKFLSQVDKIVCTSPNYFATSEVLTHFQAKTEIIPLGIEESSYPTITQDNVREAEEKWGTGYFLFVGVFRYYKGLHLLLDAALNAPYRIIIAGSGPIEPELKEQARNLGLENVVFTGHVSNEDKVALFQNCRAVVFPSYLRSEAFGITLLEGAMFGKPLISTEIGSGTSHVCVHDKNGLVIPPGNAKFLRRAMDQLYDNPKTAEQFGKNGRRRYEKLFTGSLMGSRYAELYQSLVDEITPPHKETAPPV